MGKICYGDPRQGPSPPDLKSKCVRENLQGGPQVLPVYSKSKNKEFKQTNIVFLNQLVETSVAIVKNYLHI